MRNTNLDYEAQEKITRANTVGNGFAMTAASTKNFIFSQIEEPPKEDKNDKVLDIINKVAMFKIVVDKVNKKASDTVKSKIKTTTSYSGISWPNKNIMPKPRKREQIFTLADAVVGPGAEKCNNFRKNFEELEDISN